MDIYIWKIVFLHLKKTNICVKYINKRAFFLGVNFSYLKTVYVPGWHSSVDWVRACEPKSCQLDSQSGHMPGLQARSPVGGTGDTTTHWCFTPSLSPSLPLSLKVNKLYLLKKRKQYIEAHIRLFNGIIMEVCLYHCLVVVVHRFEY